MMRRPKLKGATTSIRIDDIRDELQQALEKGYSIKEILKKGLKFVLERDKAIEELEEDVTTIKEIKMKLRELNDLLSNVLGYSPVIHELSNRANEVKMEFVELSNSITDINKELKENIDCYGEILERVNKHLDELFKKYNVSNVEAMLDLIDIIDKLRSRIMGKYSIPPDDKDMELMAQKLIDLKRIVKEIWRRK